MLFSSLPAWANVLIVVLYLEGLAISSILLTVLLKLNDLIGQPGYRPGDEVVDMPVWCSYIARGAVIAIWPLWAWAAAVSALHYVWQARQSRKLA